MSNELAKQISYILYSSPEEDVKVTALVKDESIWLTQKAMAELFDCSQDNIGLHLKNVYGSGELEKNRTAEEISVVQKEGSRSVKRNVSFYNLDTITGLTSVLKPRLWRVFDLYFGKIGFLPNATYPDWNERDEVWGKKITASRRWGRAEAAFGKPCRHPCLRSRSGRFPCGRRSCVPRSFRSQLAKCRALSPKCCAWWAGRGQWIRRRGRGNAGENRGVRF